MKVSELMTRDVIAVNPWTPLKDVARLLVERRISGLPVVDDAGAVVGVVSETDFLLKGRGRDATRPSALEWLVGEPKQTRHERAVIDATTAQDAMTVPAVTIDAAASARDAATLMIDHRVNRLPVTDAGTLVGIITRSDLLRAFVRTDAQVADAVAVALRSTDGIAVAGVVGGVVTLAGNAASRAMAERCIRVAEAVDGVVAVHGDRVTWPEEIAVTVLG